MYHSMCDIHYNTGKVFLRCNGLYTILRFIINAIESFHYWDGCTYVHSQSYPRLHYLFCLLGNDILQWNVLHFFHYSTVEFRSPTVFHIPFLPLCFLCDEKAHRWYCVFRETLLYCASKIWTLDNFPTWITFIPLRQRRLQTLLVREKKRYRCHVLLQPLTWERGISSAPT